MIINQYKGKQCNQIKLKANSNKNFKMNNIR